MGQHHSKPTIASVSSEQGARPELEDVHVILPKLSHNSAWSYFAVFDGHNGRGAAEYCAAHLHHNIDACLSDTISRHAAAHGPPTTSQSFKKASSISLLKSSNSTPSAIVGSPGSAATQAELQTALRWAFALTDAKLLGLDIPTKWSLCLGGGDGEHDEDDDHHAPRAAGDKSISTSRSALGRSGSSKDKGSKHRNVKDHDEEDDDDDDEAADEKEAARREAAEAGTTALVVLLDRQQRRVCVAHAGDSRCVWARPYGNAEALTVDHRPTTPSEMERIKAAGGTVQQGRLNGLLGVSRSIGLAWFKAAQSDQYLPLTRRALTSVPDVKTFVLPAPFFVGSMPSTQAESGKPGLPSTSDTALATKLATNGATAAPLATLPTIASSPSASPPSAERNSTSATTPPAEPLVLARASTDPCPSVGITTTMQETKLGNHVTSASKTNQRSESKSAEMGESTGFSSSVWETSPVRVRSMLQLRFLHCLVLACDGVWDVLTSQQAVDIVNREFRSYLAKCSEAVCLYLAQHGITEKDFGSDVWRNVLGLGTDAYVLPGGYLRMLPEQVQELESLHAEVKAKLKELGSTPQTTPVAGGAESDDSMRHGSKPTNNLVTLNRLLDSLRSAATTASATTPESARLKGTPEAKHVSSSHSTHAHPPPHSHSSSHTHQQGHSHTHTPQRGVQDDFESIVALCNSVLHGSNSMENQHTNSDISGPRNDPAGGVRLPVSTASTNNTGDPFLKLPESDWIKPITGAVCTEALRRGSTDNLTCLVVLLEDLPLGRAHVKQFAKDKLSEAKLLLKAIKKQGGKGALINSATLTSNSNSVTVSGSSYNDSSLKITTGPIPSPRELTQSRSGESSFSAGMSHLAVAQNSESSGSTSSPFSSLTSVQARSLAGEIRKQLAEAQRQSHEGHGTRSHHARPLHHVQSHSSLVTQPLVPLHPSHPSLKEIPELQRHQQQQSAHRQQLLILQQQLQQLQLQSQLQSQQHGMVYPNEPPIDPTQTNHRSQNVSHSQSHGHQHQQVSGPLGHRPSGQQNSQASAQLTPQQYLQNQLQMQLQSQMELQKKLEQQLQQLHQLQQLQQQQQNQQLQLLQQHQLTIHNPSRSHVSGNPQSASSRSTQNTTSAFDLRRFSQGEITPEAMAAATSKSTLPTVAYDAGSSTSARASLKQLFDQ